MLKSFVMLPPDARERLRRAEPAAMEEAQRTFEALIRRFACNRGDKIVLSFVDAAPAETRNGLAMRIAADVDGIGIVQIVILGDFLGNDLIGSDLFPPN